MNIHIRHGIEGAKEAKGLAVIIDVFRAFSVACYIADKDPKSLIAVGNIEEAYCLKEEEGKNAVLIGERESVMQPGFDYGNSPSSVKDVNFWQQTVIHTTSAGTQGIVNAKQAEEIITGSFVNVQAIVHYIRKKNPETVTLVCMGWCGTEAADEDQFCAEYIQKALLGVDNDFDGIIEFLRNKSSTPSFMTEAASKEEALEDFDLCLALDRFDFVLRSVEHHGQIHLQKEVVPCVAHKSVF
ncbi:2-phosphosulfolactate phosphatase [Virgibacillus sp. YIM 98842]|uniref:2-phosphosulfolactate phosphatase n=1 Tax=Virgibacillus sp. YIM 98842 TaxID=2663533 RepID=UPI001969DFAB|nr:2-phosphosulfolactate phosphatase [Virgibacillus sp. YIM 98842]